MVNNAQNLKENKEKQLLILDWIQLYKTINTNQCSLPNHPNIHQTRFQNILATRDPPIENHHKGNPNPS